MRKVLSVAFLGDRIFEYVLGAESWSKAQPAVPTQGDLATNADRDCASEGAVMMSKTFSGFGLQKTTKQDKVELLKLIKLLVLDTEKY